MFVFYFLQWSHNLADFYFFNSFIDVNKLQTLKTKRNVLGDQLGFYSTKTTETKLLIFNQM